MFRNLASLRRFSVYRSATSVLHPKRVNATVIKAEYAVRGRLVLTAEALNKELKAGKDLPFREIIFCNIGNPQSVGQKPISFPRQVMSLCVNPDLLSEDNLPITRKLYPEDVVTRAQNTMKQMENGLGAYSHSMGVPFLREDVANFIERRDGIPANPEEVFLTDGASVGVSMALRLLIRNNLDGVMVPVPQYPLYSATLALCNGHQIDYFLDEDKAWGTNIAELERSVEEARESGVTPRALVVINPGNPTGQVLSVEAMRDVVHFCREHNMVLLADEVYQENIYQSEKPFVSFKKVRHDMGPAYANVELLSFHSTSKGFLGECGMRGGYTEVVGVDPHVKDLMYKLVSIGLCSNLPGQLMTGLMVNPPKEGDASYPLYLEEKTAILESLGRRAKKCAEAFNKLEGVTCNHAEGSMYLFPKITVPPAAVAKAAAEEMTPDTLYALELLENTGVCVVPGSGFGQMDGTFHFRTTFLPPEEKIEAVCELMGKFHADFIRRYS